MGDIFGPEDEGGALFTSAPQLTAFERLEAEIDRLRDWPDVRAIVAAFDAWKAARDAAPMGEEADAPAAPSEDIDPEDLWTDYRTERTGLGNAHRLAFLAGVDAGRRTVQPPAPPSKEEQTQAERWARTIARNMTPAEFEALTAAMLPLVREARASASWAGAEGMLTGFERATATPAPLTEAEAMRWFELRYNAWQRDEDDTRSVRMLAVGIIQRASRGDIPADVRPAPKPTLADALAQVDAAERAALALAGWTPAATYGRPDFWTEPGTGTHWPRASALGILRDRTKPAPPPDDTAPPFHAVWPMYDDGPDHDPKPPTESPRGVDRQAATSKHPECSTCALAAKGFDVWCPHMADSPATDPKGGA